MPEVGAGPETAADEAAAEDAGADETDEVRLPGEETGADVCGAAEAGEDEAEMEDAAADRHGSESDGTADETDAADPAALSGPPGMRRRAPILPLAARSTDTPSRPAARKYRYECFTAYPLRSGTKNTLISIIYHPDSENDPDAIL